MAQFRRSLSPANHDPLMQNGTAFPLVNHSFTGAPTANAAFPAVNASDLLSPNGRNPWTWFRSSSRQGACDRLKLKGSVWKKPYVRVLFCFFVGFLVGLMPFSLPKSASYKTEAQHEFALEVKGFPKYWRHEVSRERQGEAVQVNNDTTNQSNSSRVVTSLLEQIVSDGQISDPTFGKLLIVVTPTYNRPFQAMYLTRLSYTLKLVRPPLLWLVVEMPAQTMETAVLLRNTGLMYRHLVCNENLTDIKDRGVHQRNVALAHIEQHQLDGVVYFADDDNVYTLELFQQIRMVKRFGTWPVAMLTHSKSKAILEGPVCEGQKVIGWHTNEKSKRLRRFHVDMSGFAFNSTILWDPQRWRRPNLEPIRQRDDIKEGFQETTFIEQLVEDESQMEGLPSGCSKIMVWHLHLEAADLNYPPGWKLDQNLNATISFQ